jgi:Raf kinase inhibitor-like YbhB/YbcL family protein
MLVLIVGAAYMHDVAEWTGGGTIGGMEHASTLSLTSPAFADGGAMPARYTCDDQRDMSPPLSIAGVPAETQSLVLIMDDPDIPQEVKTTYGIDVFDHWVLYDMPADMREMSEGVVAGTAGKNGAGQNAYTGPCPPPQYEPKEHRYIFILYALDTMLGLPAGATKAEVVAAMEGHILAQARLIGRYQRAQ